MNTTSGYCQAQSPPLAPLLKKIPSAILLGPTQSTTNSLPKPSPPPMTASPFAALASTCSAVSRVYLRLVPRELHQHLRRVRKMGAPPANAADYAGSGRPLTTWPGRLQLSTNFSALLQLPVDPFNHPLLLLGASAHSTPAQNNSEKLMIKPADACHATQEAALVLVAGGPLLFRRLAGPHPHPSSGTNLCTAHVIQHGEPPGKHIAQLVEQWPWSHMA